MVIATNSFVYSKLTRCNKSAYIQYIINSIVSLPCYTFLVVSLWMNSSTLTVQRKFLGHIFFLYAKKYKVYKIKLTVNFLPLGGDGEVRLVFT